MRWEERDRCDSFFLLVLSGLVISIWLFIRKMVVHGGPKNLKRWCWFYVKLFVVIVSVHKKAFSCWMVPPFRSSNWPIEEQMSKWIWVSTWIMVFEVLNWFSYVRSRWDRDCDGIGGSFSFLALLGSLSLVEIPCLCIETVFVATQSQRSLDRWY